MLFALAHRRWSHEYLSNQTCTIPTRELILVVVQFGKLKIGHMFSCASAAPAPLYYRRYHQRTAGPQSGPPSSRAVCHPQNCSCHHPTTAGSVRNGGAVHPGTGHLQRQLRHDIVGDELPWDSKRPYGVQVIRVRYVAAETAGCLLHPA